ncbi:MAG: tetratricopeptide repeat protein [Flavobacteriales bacterium]
MKHYLVLFFLLVVQFFTTAQVPDSLFSSARNPNLSIKERVILYDEIGYQTSHFDFEKSLLYADTAVQLARNEGDSALVAFALNGKSVPYLRTGKYTQTKAVLNAALKADTSDINLTARIIGKLAKVNQELGNWDEAMKTYMRCYEIFKQTDDSRNLGIACNHISMLFIRQDKLNEAEIYIREAIRIHKKDDDLFNYASACSSLSQLFEQRDELDSALFYSKLNTKLIRELKREPELGGALINEGTILLKQQNYNQAMPVFQEAYDIAEHIGDKSDIMFASKNMGAIHYLQGKYKEAKPLLLRAAKIGEEGYYEKLINTFQFLSDISLIENDIEASKSFRDKYEKGLQAKYDAEEAKQLATLNTKFKLAQQKALISERDLELQRGETIMARQHTQNVILIGVLVLLALVSLFWFFWNRNRQELLLNKTIYAEREKGFVQVVEATEAERDRISKDLHDGIGQQLTALRLALNSLSKKVGLKHQEEIDTVLHSFSRSAEDVRLLSHQMMPRMLMNFGLPEAMDDLLKNSFLHVETSYEFDHRGMEERLDKNVEIAVYRVIQELINNALKHAEASTFSVQLIRSEKKLAGFISDNGKGFNSQNLSEGHGLKNMKNRLALINGTIDIDSSPGKGTSVSLSIPLS